MKLEKYENKNNKRKKVMLISLGVLVLVSISFLLYKSFARFTETVEFPIVNGKVDYFGNSDVYFAFYKGDEQLTKMPTKDNPENLEFDHAVCDNGAEVEWNDAKWAPLVINLTENKTKCSLYFDKYVPTSFADAVVRCGKKGTVATECIKKYASLDASLIEDDTDDKNLRYTGANPSNYVTFNGNEKWRIIGIIDGKLKIIRSESIGDMENGDSWAKSPIKDYINNTYQINSNLVEIGTWNIGGTHASPVKKMYSEEQMTKWTGRVGLITPSDYGFAVGGDVRTSCLAKHASEYGTGNCNSNDWLSLPSTSYGYWTINGFGQIAGGTSYLSGGQCVTQSYGSTYCSYSDANAVYPVVYLNASTRITGGNGSSVPFTLGF